MPDDATPGIQIVLTTEFKKNLRDLAKRYRSIRKDIELAVSELQQGNFVGDRIPRLGSGYVVLKMRVRNRDIQKGKSAGYRLIYQITSSSKLVLLTVYSKSDRPDITIDEIREIIGTST